MKKTLKLKLIDGVPYGISDEEIVTGDYIITPNNEIGKVGYLDREAKLFSTNLPILSDRGCKKVVLQPDQFNYQDIIDLNLKDGDEFLYLYDPFTKAPAKGFTGHAILQSTEYKIEQPVTVIRDLDMYLNEFGNALMNAQALGQYQKSSNGVAQFVIDYLNKKK